MNRRRLLQLSALAGSRYGVAGDSPLASLAALNDGATPHVIERLEIFRLEVNRRGNWIIPRVTTSGGVSGIGDASQTGAADELQLELLQKCFATLKGRDIHSVEWLRCEYLPEIARYGLPVAVAASALEQCLWDIMGKIAGVPVYDL